MNGRATLGMLIITACLLGAAPAEARVQRIQRGPDRVVNYCNQQQFGAKCAPIAAGDLNGDGKTDAVFLRRSGANQRSVNGDFSRSLDILFGPFSGVGSGGGRADVAVSISAGNGIPSVTVADFDGDGLQDLVYAEAARSLGVFPPAELQRVAVLKGQKVWDPIYTMGPAYQGSHVLERRAPLNAEQIKSTTANGRRASRLTPLLSDVNGDGKADLLLAVDPAADEEPMAIGSIARTIVRGEVPSHLLVFLDAPSLAARAEGTTLSLEPGEESSFVEGQGSCSAAGLLGAGDLNQDGLTDIVTRRCPGRAVPDMLGLVPGRRDWPARLRIDGAVTAEPEILPPGPEPTRAPVEPEPPRGYVSFSPTPKSLFDRPAAFFLQDVNQDGALDLGFGFSDKTHVWLGGRDIATRLRRNHSDRVYLQAGFGGTSLSGTWRVSDLTGDGRPDLLLTQRGGASLDASAERPVPAPIVLGGAAADDSRPSGVTGGGREVLAEPLKIYAGARTGQRVLDLAADQPDAVISDPALDLWLIGDFNGDGRDDLMLGSPGQSSTSSYQVLYGPFGG